MNAIYENITVCDPLSEFKQHYQTFIDNLSRQKPVVIIAGHYCLADHMQELSSSGEAESQGFELGVQLYLRGQRKNPHHHLVVWVNDIGISTEERQLYKQSNRLPENYQLILQHYGLETSIVKILFESHMRNKASTRVRKIVKKHPGLLRKVNANARDLVRCVENNLCNVLKQDDRYAYVITGPDNEQLVVKEGPSPKCNLILATFFDELTKQYQPTHFVNIFNDIYAYRLRLGVHVAQTLLKNTVSMTNVLCDGHQIRCESY